MLAESFIEGFRYELANRAFALLVMERMAEHLQGDPSHPFWKAYRDLEMFNHARYKTVAMHWGLSARPDRITRFKAWVVTAMPRRCIPLLLRLVYGKTVRYVGRLRDLRRAGPVYAKEFLDYVVAQEELQVEMMRLALEGRYSDIIRCADDFFLKYNGVRFTMVQA